MTGCPPGERAARAALSASLEPPAEPIARHLVAHGPEATLAALRAGTVPRLDPGGRVHRRLTGLDGKAVLDAGAEAGSRFVCPGDDEWPAALYGLAYAVEAAERWAPPPVGLWLRGPAELGPVLPRSVAVVGARAATDYGRRVATELSADLAARGWTVVSGAAYGIDAAAHRGALAVGGVTVAVLACGVDVLYPRGHAALLERILDDGLLVSELPPGTPPNRPRFLARNRLIAAMTRGTAVVEAALRSGALSTANWAVDVGRPLVAVPGPVTSTLSAGCHELIRSGAAVLATDATEVADAIGDLTTDAAPSKHGKARPLDDLDPVAQDVFEAMPARSVVSVDRLCGVTGLSVAACLSALGELASRGLVERAEGGWRMVRRPRDVPTAAMLDLG